jgi:hypothetical protein
MDLLIFLHFPAFRAFTIHFSEIHQGEFNADESSLLFNFYNYSFYLISESVVFNECSSVDELKRALCAEIVLSAHNMNVVRFQIILYIILFIFIKKQNNNMNDKQIG